MILIFAFCMLFFGRLQTATAQIVHIPDSNLRAALEFALDKEVGADITQADMANIRSLDAPESGIQNLSGLECAVNLVTIHLGLNRVSDLSPLKTLKNLVVLDLHRNQRISDKTPLKNLKKLVWLSIRGNYISDLSPLSALTNLTFLYIGYNHQLSNIASLSVLTNLIYLDMEANRISDLSSIENLTNLISLDFDSNLITDVPLRNITKLIHLDASDNLITDVSPLKNM